ncbi:MAG: hydroxyacid dehydrogenase [Bacteroidales bacterium]|nr:hydroxyacid dehydrogenase [Bacteroidales bacterium]
MKILFVDSTHKILKQKFEQAGWQCDYFPDINYEKTISIIHQYDGIIIRSKIKVDKTLLSCAKKLKFIGRVGAGMESIDTETAKKLGIACFNSPEGNRDAVGEHAIGMLLSLLNKLYLANTQVKQGIWQREENRGIEIKGKTIGIIGYGNMGSSFANKLKGFEVNIIAYDKYKYNFENEWVKEVTLEQLQNQSDIISLHVPLTDETYYMINKPFIDACAKPFYLINTARGPVVKTIDLIHALDEGKVLGAALDVIEYEEHSFEKLKQFPEDFYRLASFENVILTPHIAGWTYESKIKLAEILADKILMHFNQ